MDDIQDVNSTDTISDFFVPNRKKIELLQSILRTESGSDISFDYAEEVGIQLISLYECLAREKTIVPELQNEGQ